MVFVRYALAAFFILLNAPPASAQTKIRYLLTSPSPNVAEATHSSVPEALGYWKDAVLDLTVTTFNGGTSATLCVISGNEEFTIASPPAFIFVRPNSSH